MKFTRKKVKVAEINHEFVELIPPPYTGKRVYFTGKRTENSIISGNAFFVDERRMNYITLNKDAECYLLPKTEVNKLIRNGDYAHTIDGVMLSNGSIGADPELFAINKDGIIIPAFMFLNDKKTNPNIYWDGFQAEFTPYRDGGGHCLAYFTDQTQKLMSQLLYLARVKFPDARLTWQSVLEIPKEMMDKAEPVHKELGCAPSTNIYELPPIDVPDPSSLPIRFAGSHMHFGTGVISKAKVKSVIESLDKVIGIMSISLLQGMEDERRRIFYGRAGEYRTPKWGIEYRTMSAAMLAHPIIWHFTFDMARFVVQIGLQGGSFPLWRAPVDTVIRTINEYNLKLAKKILKINDGLWKYLIQRRYGSHMVEPLVKLVDEGAINHLPNLNSMEKAWKLDSNTWKTHSSTTNCCVGCMRVKSLNEKSPEE